MAQKHQSVHLKDHKNSQPCCPNPIQIQTPPPETRSNQYSYNCEHASQRPPPKNGIFQNGAKIQDDLFLSFNKIKDGEIVSK
jgi:hypothetical protein